MASESTRGSKSRSMTRPDKELKTKVYDRETGRWRSPGKFTEGSTPGKNAKKS